MHEIIDVPSDIQDFARPLAEAGVKSVIRYYNHRNSSALPTKCLTNQELGVLHDAGLSVAVVFQQRGGADGNLADLDQQSGIDDAQRALNLATDMVQPEGSAIYFAVDFDYFRASELAQIASYFDSVRQTLNGKYSVGIYGSGTVGRHLKARGLVDHIWLAGAMGWSGTRAALEEGDWTIFQKFLEQRSEIGGFTHDGNVVNPSFGSFGQFGTDEALPTPRGEGAAALFKVIARSGLNLRAGASETFRILDTLPSGALVTGLRRDGAWIQVDVEGDGQADGFMSERFLQPVSGGLPMEPPAGGDTALRQPIDVARAELNLGVSEVSGSNDHNPRIVMYHGTTVGGMASDETAWCSSFVNFCVEQAGLDGTDSKLALSWRHWGRDVTDDAAEGDIVVFRRAIGGDPVGGHVGFFLNDEGSQIRLLGGNQGNRISIARFPKDGVLGDTHYTLLSIRRG